MFCNNCGTKLEEDALFCPNCGSRADSAAQMETEDDRTVILREEAVENPIENANDEPAQDAQNEQEKEQASVQGQSSQEQSAQKQEETIEAVEISPTGVVETNAAIAVPNDVQKKFCPNCGTANHINDLFCQECGMFFGNAEEKMGKEMTRKPQKNAKVIKIAISAVLVALFAAFLFIVPRFVKSGGNDKDRDFIVYIKDNEIFMAKSNKFEPQQVGDKFFEDKEDVRTYSYYGGISYSPDYKYIYYPKNFETYDYTYDLYYRKAGNQKAGEEKIDSDVLSYEVIDNNRIAYIKDYDDHKLYLYDGNDSVKITSDAAWMTVSDDGKYILWRSNDGDNKLYVQDTAMKADKKKLDSDISYLCAYSDDLQTIIYEKDDNLYVVKDLGEKEKIASDVDGVNVHDINGNFQIYYVKESDETSLSAYDLIKDDYLSQDQNITEPRLEDYQTVTYVDDFFSSREKIETDDAYYQDVEKYEEKKARDELREELKRYELVDTQSGDLYYYNAKKGESVKVMEAAMVLTADSIGTDTALMYLWSLDLDSIEKPKLSKLLEGNGEDAEEILWETIYENMQFLYLKGEEVFVIDDSDMDRDNLDYVEVYGNEKTGTMYIQYDFYNPESEKYHAELYSYDYQSADAELKLLCDDFASVISCNSSEGIYYINEEEDLYCNDTKIDSDVYESSVAVQDNGTVLYLTDIDDNYREGTLKIWQGGETDRIADDVAIYTYGVFDQNKVAFLADYNFDKCRGDLVLYNGKETTRIDSDVTSVVY